MFFACMLSVIKQARSNRTLLMVPTNFYININTNMLIQPCMFTTDVQLHTHWHRHTHTDQKKKATCMCCKSAHTWIQVNMTFPAFRTIMQHKYKHEHGGLIGHTYTHAIYRYTCMYHTYFVNSIGIHPPSTFDHSFSLLKHVRENDWSLCELHVSRERAQRYWPSGSTCN